jgi:hypothetical protein
MCRSRVLLDVRELDRSACLGATVFSTNMTGAACGRCLYPQPPLPRFTH